jgi:hypothetical protein
MNVHDSLSSRLSNLCSQITNLLRSQYMQDLRVEHDLGVATVERRRHLEKDAHSILDVMASNTAFSYLPLRQPDCSTRERR